MTSITRRQLFFGVAAATITLPQILRACEKDPCPFDQKPGHKPTGTINLPLQYWVNVCHPDKDVALWWSFVKTTSENYMNLVNQVMAKPKKPLADEVEAPAGQCKQAFYEPGWRILTVSDCRIKGKSVFLLSRPLTAADNGKTLVAADWQQLPYEF